MQFKGHRLNPFQVEAAEAIRGGANVLVSAPTGAGKTLVAEYAIEDAISQGRRAIYTSPIKALSNQKFRDFRADGVDVGLMTGDLTLNADAPLVIMTTEIFRNAVFEAPERFDSVDFVIFDEIHFMDDPERGTVWEESVIFAPAHVRIVGLSATIRNLAEFGSWLEEVREQELAVIHSTKRPVPLRHMLFHEATGLFRLAQRRQATQRMLRLAKTDRGQRGQGGGRDRRSDGGRGRPQRKRRDTGRAAGAVLDHLQAESLLPVLYFCFSRKECEIKGDRNQHRRLLNASDRTRIEELFAEICETFELDPKTDLALQQIQKRGRCGIGYHHAGMLPIHKEVVERMFTSGLLRMLFTTETFALGINMPARTVVFDSLRKFDGVTFDYMGARDYMQMAGRAGRQGLDDEGLVISLLDDEALVEAPLSDLFGGKVEPVQSRFNLSYSTILNLYDHMGMELIDAYERSFAAFQARSKNKKAQDRQRNQARAALMARIHTLDEAGYLDSEGLLPRGRIAKRINGYEIQVTELLFDGVLDAMDMHQLAVTFAALVHQDRRHDDGAKPGRGVLGQLAHRVEKAVSRFAAVELTHGIDPPIKPPNYGIVPVVHRWSSGADLRELQDLLGNDGGDAVRTMRMAIMMMRQLRQVLGRDYAVGDRLQEAIVCINRDVVDAKRQFELG